MASSYKLPKGWLDKTPISNGVIDSTFIAFKTPLDYNYRNKVGGLVFDVNSVFDYARAHNIEIGLWIDLTCVDRYYDKEKVMNRNCRYLKLGCRGGGMIPRKNMINRFINICLNYKLKFPNGIIAVHCTHGHNRTGFFIISYLVQCRNWSVGAAIDEFAKLRPPGIYRERYVDELWHRLGQVPAHCVERRQRRNFQN